MAKHIKVYEDFFGCRDCELTGLPRGDVHHIRARGSGGSKLRDNIENLMALNRIAHDYFGDKKQFKEWLQEWHEEYIINRVPMYLSRPDDPIFREFLKSKYEHFI